MPSLLGVWHEWEIQVMVLTSFTLQLFLLLTGNLRRRSISGPLRVLIWLVYVGADAVAIYALGLFSKYEKFITLGSSSGDATPFLWVPFLLVHLGGQDSITAFSIEDNNLWLRHLLNLGIQVALALYVFWKSIHRLNSQVLIPAALVFCSGIIKYGERTWALRTGSRDGLGKSSLKLNTRKEEGEQSNQNDDITSSRDRASYALQTVLLAQGLFVGRTMLQLGHGAQYKFEKHFKTHRVEVEEKLKIMAMELGMMFDLLYTKAMVLQRWTGCAFRCAAQISMCVAFVVFLQKEKDDHNHSRVNTAITYTLFVGAIFMEVCSVATVLASPWTRAHLKDGAFVRWISSIRKALSRMKKAIVQGHYHSSDYAIGQFNYTDFGISHSSTPWLICKVISILGLGEQWKKLRHVKRVEAQGIVEYMVKWFDRSPEDPELFRQLQLGPELNYTLCLPFEHALYRLQIYTDLHISRHFDDVVPGAGGGSSGHAADVMLLKEQCEKLSNYMLYISLVYPSMVPVSAVAHDGSFGLPGKREDRPRLAILEATAEELYNEREPYSACPFKQVARRSESHLKRSLEEIREMWMRLLVFAAGKCGGELHARQLSRGGELLTFAWLLMLHHGLGDAATEVKFLASDDPSLPELGSVVAAEGSNWGPRLEQPRYAFDFRRQADADRGGISSVGEQLVGLVHMMQQVVPRRLAEAIVIENLIEQFLPEETEQEEDNNVTTTGEEQDEAVETPGEIVTDE